jgi:hypothetical protein
MRSGMKNPDEKGMSAGTKWFLDATGKFAWGKILGFSAGAIFPAGSGAAFGRWLLGTGASMNNAIYGGLAVGIPVLGVVIAVISGRRIAKRASADAKEARASANRAEASLRIKNTATDPTHALSIPQVNNGAVTIGLQTGKSIGCGAIGEIRTLTIERFIIGTTFKFSCMCVVDFLWLREGAKSSPSELRLMSNATNSPYHLATLENKEPILCPCQVNYQGTGDWDLLMQTVSETMTVSQDRKSHPPWESHQPVETLFCNVAVHSPGGEAGKSHNESQTRMVFELGPQGYDVFTVKIIVPPKTGEESARFLREAAKQL